MKIDTAQVEKLAHLSRLEFSDAEKEEMVEDMNKILGFVEKINELDLGDVEPLVYLTEEDNKWREDQISDQVSREEALKNAPDRDTDYFRVPKVLKRGDA